MIEDLRARERQMLGGRGQGHLLGQYRLGRSARTETNRGRRRGGRDCHFIFGDVCTAMVVEAKENATSDDQFEVLGSHSRRRR